ELRVLHSFPTRRSSDLQNELNFQRSAIAPVGMVAVASMNTSWKKKKPRIDTSYACPVRKNPDFAKMFQSPRCIGPPSFVNPRMRSEEHTSELQSRSDLV